METANQQQQPNGRFPKCTLILGTNGTGKSTLLRNILEKSGQKCLVVSNHPEEWEDVDTTELASRDDFLFHGIRKTTYRQPTKERKGTLDRLMFFRKGIVVFDDCRMYLRDLKDDRMIENLMISYRQLELDVFIVAHGFSMVRPVFYPYVSDLFLFKTRDSVQSRKKELSVDGKFEIVLKAQAEVNRKATKNLHYFKYLKF